MKSPTPIAKRSTVNPNVASRLAIARSVFLASEAAPSVTNTTTVGTALARQPDDSLNNVVRKRLTAWCVAVPPFCTTGVMARRADPADALVEYALKSKTRREEESKLMAATRESAAPSTPIERGSICVSLAVKSSI